MKKTSLFILCAFCAGCSENVRKDALADVIRRDPYEFLAGRLSAAHERMPNHKIAVLPFSYTDKRDTDDGVVVSERILTRMIQEGKLEVVERNLLEKVMGELKLQYSGAVDETSIKSLGKILGVDAVVTGTLMRQTDGRIEINARLIRTETAIILSAASVVVPCDWEMLLAEQAAAPAPEAQADARPPVPEASAADFPKTWKYHENLRVAEKSGSSLVDYQVLVKFDSAGLIKLGRMKPDCSDLRFSNSNETSKLNYWIESGCNTPDTRVWVRLPFLAKSSVKNIYLHYGNPVAESESKGDLVFMLFDDFNANAIDPVKWEKIQGRCEVRETNNKAEFEACSRGLTWATSWLRTAGTFVPPYIVDFDAYSDKNPAGIGQYHVLGLRWDGHVYGAGALPNSGVQIMLFDGFPPSSAGTGASITDKLGGEGRTLAVSKQFLSPETWNRYSVIDAAKRVKVLYNGQEFLSAEMSGSGGGYVGIAARDSYAPDKAYYDNFRVRKYAEIEPYVYFYRQPVYGTAGRNYRTMR